MKNEAQLCPVCQGLGKIDRAWLHPSQATSQYEICNGCGGSGWVIIPQPDIYVKPPDSLHPDTRTISL